MADDPLDPGNDPKPEKLITERLPDPLPPSEREVLEGKIIDLQEKLDAALAELDGFKNPKPSPKPKQKGLLERFAP
jgi:hypothetical protein